MKEANAQWSTRRCLKMAEALRAFGMNSWESVGDMLNGADNDSIYLDPQLDDVSVQDCIDKYRSMVTEESTLSGIEARPDGKDALERVIKMLRFRRIDEVKSLLAENAEEIRILAEQLSKSKSKFHLSTRATGASSPGPAAGGLQTPTSASEEDSPTQNGPGDNKYPLSPLIDEPLKPQSLSNPPAEKGGSAPADNGIERADSSTQLRRLRVRSADSDGVPKATKSYSTVKRVYKRMSDARKHTIASRVTTRHDRASKKRSIMLSTHLTTPKLAQSSSEHIRKSQKKASTEVLENRKPSKYTSDKRILRSAAGSYKKELTLRAHKSPTKNISRVVASTSIRSHKSQRAPPTKRLVKPKKPVYKTKASSLLKKTRKYKKGKKFKNSK